ncbi:MAG: hypothetical protein PHU07_11905 [Acidocella sp.]|nr:hypothetical protein [Acidocella sp.]
MKLFVLAALGSLAAGAAFARQYPSEPPSGTVIHLFGPNSLTSHILPTAPAASGTAPAGAAGTAHGTASPAAPAAAGGSPAAAGGGTSSDMSTSDILHEMFVTGDPNQPDSAKLSKGRPGARQ